MRYSWDKNHNHQKENGAKAKKPIDFEVSQAKEIFFIATNVICVVLSTSIFHYIIREVNDCLAGRGTPVSL